MAERFYLSYLFLFLCWLAHPVHSSCYWSNGDQGNANALFPCNPSSSVSTCCGGTDFCTSNGLCIDAAGDNIFSFQGCTSKSWDAPCKNYCGPGNFLRKVWQCGSKASASNMTYCCGDDASCCSSNNLFELTVSDNIFRPPAITTGSSAVPGATNTASTSSSSPTETNADSTSGKSADNTKTLAIGLGVGLGAPLALSIVAALVYVGWQLRKSNKSSRTDSQTSFRGHSVPIMQQHAYMNSQDRSNPTTTPSAYGISAPVGELDYNNVLEIGQGGRNTPKRFSSQEIARMEMNG